MAPPVLTKRALPPDPPDVGNRVSETTLTLNRSNVISMSKARSTLHTHAALQKSSILEKKLGVKQFSMDEQDDENLMMDVKTGEPPNNIINTDPLDEDFPPLTIMATSMKLIRMQLHSWMLFFLNSQTLSQKKLEEDHPGVGADFLALVANGASRAMRGERIYTSLQKTTLINSKVSHPSWAEKAEVLENSQTISLKKQTIRATSPRAQGKEDRRVIIGIGPDHEALKISYFEPRQNVSLHITDKTIIADVWTVPSGVAILAPTPAKAAALLQFNEAIENRFGAACVERQET
ncbi:hypothetical protein EPUL_003478 [Erysiphe pulchra]|uniref:Uncharacterized protein n=1 Tax=Erysiphe pulchra TaxID=225359 RepID=A0A2S4PNQ6_9PEZI|nr:hypothetical protein EPUL_003478 [Erysiphe pulchra]